MSSRAGFAGDVSRTERASRRARGVLAGCLATAAVLAACGPGEGAPGPVARTPTKEPLADGGPPASTARVPPPPVPSGTASKTEPARIAMHPVVATSMGTALAEIGIDTKALPPLNKLPPDQLRKVMRTFTKSLGVPCSHCHDTKDFRAPTANKTIATHMWNDFTRTLVLDRGPLYCDSCHDGRAKILDRHDPEALGRWMQANYVEPLKRVDQQGHGCPTCHGDPFEGKILTRRWK